MKNFIEIKKTLASNWFKVLQEKIVEEFELLEKKYNKKKFAKKRME
jgi:coproporphyrinogen III oxidase